MASAPPTPAIRRRHVALEELMQAIPIEAGTTQTSVELHSGIARLYPRVYGNLVQEVGSKSKVGVILVHPMSNFHGHHMLQPIAASGLPIIGLNTRYAGNDAVIILENCLLDVDAAVRHARNTLGWEKVILAGFSGGGPLVSMYHKQSIKPTIKATPAGDPPDFTTRELAKVDALLLMASSPSRAQLLTEFIDPSVIDEQTPDLVDEEYNLYAEGRTLPLDRDWVARYRVKQKERMQRLEDWVIAELDRLGKMGIRDRAFIVHKTVADPRFVDITIDPSDREVGTIWGDGKSANQACGPMGRFTSLRSWLSTWSPTYSNGDTCANLAEAEVPVCIIGMGADQGSLSVHNEQQRDAVPPHLLDYNMLKGATHYFFGQPEMFPATVKIIQDWREKRGLI